MNDNEGWGFFKKKEGVVFYLQEGKEVSGQSSKNLLIIFQL